MEWPVVLASALQLGDGRDFRRDGRWSRMSEASHAQAVAEDEVVRQGLPADLLARGHVNFKESATELAFPFLIAAVLTALALLNLAGSQTGRVATWVSQSILILAGGFITAQQVFAVRFVQYAFAKSGDDALARVDVEHARAPKSALRNSEPSREAAHLAMDAWWGMLDQLTHCCTSRRSLVDESQAFECHSQYLQIGEA